MTKTFWTDKKARWYRRGLDHSGMAGAVLPIIGRVAPKARSFLDIGSGCGALSLPLLRAGKAVTAVDPSGAMLEILTSEAKKEGLRNLSTINATWREMAGEAEVKAHDVIICANVPELLKGSVEFAGAADRLAGEAVFLIENADPASDKFYYKDLFPLILGKDFEGRKDYIATYEALHSAGIFANVEIIDYDFDQPFDDLNEAVEFWREYMGLKGSEKDGELRNYLGGRLVKKDGGDHTLVAKFSKKSAVMWWRT